jgi:ribosomal protein S18 acetylase RimI-like enzyme
MLDRITRFFKRQKHPQPAQAPARRRPDGFQDATLEDEDYIFEQIQAEARAGHFNNDYLLPQTHSGLRAQLKSTIQQHSCQSHRPGLRRSCLFVHILNDAPVGFSWAWEGQKPGSWELYLLAVDPTHRKRNFGKGLLDGTISVFPSKTNFEARLYKSSTTMRGMLVSVGFVFSRKDKKLMEYVSP